MFKVFNNSNVENAVYIQGARHSNTSPIASIVFQNYDYNTEQTYTMAAMSLVDHYGNALSNGCGDLVFKSKTPDSSGMVDNVKIMYNGDVSIGAPSTTAKLSVAGAIHADGSITASNIAASEISTSNVSTQIYKTQKILFNKFSSSNYVQNLVLMLNSNVVKLDAACIVSGTLEPSLISNLDASAITKGNLSSSVFPASLILDHVYTSNITTYTNTTTPRISFMRGSNTLLLPVGSNVNVTLSNIYARGSIYAQSITLEGDPITIFQDNTTWEPVSFDNNITITKVHSRYSRINSVINIHYSFMLIVPSQTSNIDISLPVAPRYTIKKPTIFTDISGVDIYGTTVVNADTSNLRLSFGSSQIPFPVGHWYTSDSITYEAIA